MLAHGLKRSTNLALAGALTLALGGVAASDLAAAPLASPSAGIGVRGSAQIEPVVYRHAARRHYAYRHYHRGNGAAVGAAVAGTALGLIGGAIAAGSDPYYGNGYGPGYGYGPGPYYGGYGGW